MWQPPGTFNVAIEAVIIKDGKILITQRSFERDHLPGEWEILTGRVNQNESLEDAAKREVKEEVGLEIEIIQPFNTFHFYRGKERAEHLGVSFICRYVSGDIVLDKNEQIDYKWATPEEAERIITHEGILDSIRKTKAFI